MKYKITHYDILLKDIGNECIESNNVDIILYEKEIEKYKKKLEEKYNDKDVIVYLTYTEIK